MSYVAIFTAIIGPFLYIVLLAGFFIYLFRKKYNFQTILPLALISTVLFVYLFTIIFHNITAAFLITAFAALGFIPLLLLDKNRKNMLGELFLTPGFVIFCLIYFFTLALNWSKVVPLLSDTSMHWAPHVWTMWLRDDFYTSPNLSLVIHGDYPPAVQLFQVLWSKAAGIYREGLLFTALQVLSFSMIFPVFTSFTWSKGKLTKLKDLSLTILLTVSLVSLPLIFFVSDFYSSLEVDTILAFVFAYGVYLAITESKKFSHLGLFKISLVITFLVLTKQIAVILAGIIIIIYIACLFLENSKKVFLPLHTINRVRLMAWLKKHRKSLVVAVILILLPLIFMKLWSAQTTGYVSPDKGVAIFHLDPLDTLQIPDILQLDSGTAAQKHFGRGFIKHAFLEPGGFLINFIGSISYMQVLLLFVGSMMFIWYITKTNEKRHRLILLAVVLTGGWFLYCFAIYSVFLFGGMNSTELSNLNTPNRYLRTYLFALLLILFILFIDKVIRDHANRVSSKSFLYFTSGIFILFILFMNKGTYDALGIDSIDKHKDEFNSLNTPFITDRLTQIYRNSGSTFENPKKILVTAQSDKERHYLQYRALPNRIELLLLDSSLPQEIICSKLRTNEYLVLGNRNITNEQQQRINSCGSRAETLRPGTLYLLKKDINKVNLSQQ